MDIGFEMDLSFTGCVFPCRWMFICGCINHYVW